MQLSSVVKLGNPKNAPRRIHQKCTLIKYEAEGFHGSNRRKYGRENPEIFLNSLTMRFLTLEREKQFDLLCDVKMEQITQINGYIASLPDVENIKKLVENVKRYHEEVGPYE